MISGGMLFDATVNNIS